MRPIEKNRRDLIQPLKAGQRRAVVALSFALASALAFALVFAMGLALALPARASETPDFYAGTRQLGMGNSYVGVVNDETALLTNPAGLGKIRDVTFNLFNPQVQGSFTDTDLFTSANYTNATDAQGLYDALNSAKNVPFDARASVFPSLVVPDFGIGVLGKVSYDAISSTSTGTFTMNYTADYAAAMGYTLRFWGGVVKLGVAGRVVDRAEANFAVASGTTTGLSIASSKREGMGIASDVGIILTAPIQWLPSLSAVARDVGGTSYGLGPGMFGATTFKPADTPTRIDAAFTISPLLSNNTRAQLTFEAHDLVTISQETDTYRRYHAGLEINFSDFFFLRGGLNGRYWTAGVEFATRYFQLQGASYGQEVGTATVPIEDRRWVGSFAIRF